MTIYEIAALLRVILYGVVAPMMFVLSIVFWTKRERALSVMFLFIVAIVMLQQYGLITVSNGQINQDALLLNTFMWFGMTVFATVAATRYALAWMRSVLDMFRDRWCNLKSGGSK